MSKAEHHFDIARGGQPLFDARDGVIFRKRLRTRGGFHRARVHIRALAERDHHAISRFLRKPVDAARAEDELLCEAFDVDTRSLRCIDDGFFDFKRSDNIARLQLFLGVPCRFAAKPVGLTRQREDARLDARKRRAWIARTNEERGIIQRSTNRNTKFRWIRREFDVCDVFSFRVEPRRKYVARDARKIKQFTEFLRSTKCVDVGRDREIERILRQMRESRGLSRAACGKRREWRHRFTHANSADEEAKRIDIDRDDSVCEHVEEFQRALAIRFHLFARTTEATTETATKTTGSCLKCSIRNLRAACGCDGGGQRIARTPRDEIRAFEPCVFVGALDARSESFTDSTRAIGWQRRAICRERDATFKRLCKEHEP